MNEYTFLVYTARCPIRAENSCYPDSLYTARLGLKKFIILAVLTKSQKIDEILVYIYYIMSTCKQKAIQKDRVSSISQNESYNNHALLKILCHPAEKRFNNRVMSAVVHKMSHPTIFLPRGLIKVDL